MVEDVLEVEEVRGVADVDELRGHLFARARCLVVRDPELGRSAVSGDGDATGAEADMSVSVSSERSDKVGVLGGEESVEEQVDDAILEKIVEWGLKGQPSRGHLYLVG